jgi:hypothetical protein
VPERSEGRVARALQRHDKPKYDAQSVRSRTVGQAGCLCVIMRQASGGHGLALPGLESTSPCGHQGAYVSIMFYQ